jgi:hypothetical protein
MDLIHLAVRTQPAHARSCPAQGSEAMGRLLNNAGRAAHVPDTERMPPFPAERESGLEPDHSVVVTLAPVHDAGTARVGVGEEVEVVTDQFHA